MAKGLLRIINDIVHPQKLIKSDDEPLATGHSKAEVIEVEVIKEPTSLASVIPSSRPTSTIYDSSTGQILEEPSIEADADSQSLAVKEQTPRDLHPNLPEDIAKLAGKNKAFYRGLIALQNLNLDNDLFLEAVEDLRRKYYREDH